MGIGKYDRVEILCIFLQETEQAILVENNHADQVWIPKSLISDWEDDLYERHDDIEIMVPTWLAMEEEFI